jgi:hypothetical protein
MKNKKYIRELLVNNGKSTQQRVEAFFYLCTLIFKLNNTMKKIILNTMTVALLAAIAFLADGCGQAKKQTGYGNIPSDSIQTVTKTCLVVKYPEVRHFEDETAEGADEYYTVVDDFVFYMAETDTRFQKLGIKMITVEKRYLSFALGNGENHIIDTKEQSIWDAFLYKDGHIPITVDIVINNWTDIAAYLDLSESEVIWLTGEDDYEESGDPGYTFESIDRTLNDEYTGDNCVIALTNNICQGVMVKEIANTTSDVTFSVEYPQITSATINGEKVSGVSIAGANAFLYSSLVSYEGNPDGNVDGIRQSFFNEYIEYKNE